MRLNSISAAKVGWNCIAFSQFRSRVLAAPVSLVLSEYYSLLPKWDDKFPALRELLLQRLDFNLESNSMWGQDLSRGSSSLLAELWCAQVFHLS